jgi:hypothetical protein
MTKSTILTRKRMSLLKNKVRANEMARAKEKMKLKMTKRFVSYIGDTVAIT